MCRAVDLKPDLHAATPGALCRGDSTGVQGHPASDPTGQDYFPLSTPIVKVLAHSLGGKLWNRGTPIPGVDS